MVESEVAVVPTEQVTQRVQRIWDRQAEHFDEQMGFWERVLFDGDREWACGQAAGDVLELVHQERRKAGIVDRLVARKAPGAGRAGGAA